MSLLVLLIGILQINYSFDYFIHSFKCAYEDRVTEYLDSKLIYIPRIMNLSEKHDNWDKLSIDQKKDSLFYYLSTPVLADEYAVDIVIGDYYRFPMGLLEYNNKYQTHNITGPIKYKGWFYNEVISPLICYLRSHNVDFVFTVDYFTKKSTDEWWTIENGSVFKLLYDKNNNSLHSVDAQKYIREIAPLDSFASTEDLFHPSAHQPSLF